MRIRNLAAALALVTVGFAGTASADETLYCNTTITTLPFTITTQGHYCFDRNLSTAITSGAAITIAADFVTLDLNNFKLGGGSAGLGTNAFGVYAFDRSNLTIRGGNIRGFAVGIQAVLGSSDHRSSAGWYCGRGHGPQPHPWQHAA